MFCMPRTESQSPCFHKRIAIGSQPCLVALPLLSQHLPAGLEKEIHGD